MLICSVGNDKVSFLCKIAEKLDLLLLFQTHYQESPAVTNSLIEYHPRRSDHGQRITCRAENPEMIGSAIEDSLDLSVMCKYSH